jgi:hypothetical protein
MAPLERQYQTDHGPYPAPYGDDHRRRDHLRGGAGRDESGSLSNDDTHVGDAEGLSPAFVRHPDDELGVGRDLVDTKRSRQ